MEILSKWTDILSKGTIIQPVEVEVLRHSQVLRVADINFKGISWIINWLQTCKRKRFFFFSFFEKWSQKWSQNQPLPLQSLFVIKLAKNSYIFLSIVYGMNEHRDSWYTETHQNWYHFRKGVEKGLLQLITPALTQPKMPAYTRWVTPVWCDNVLIT
jgi:hypothetical protein